jgi:regulator of protease activity HflC (stomatin/prohibitin superfamily)
MTLATARDSELGGAWAQSAKLSFRFLFIAVGLAAIGWTVSNVRQVPPDSRALVYRFGTIARQQGAGLLIAWPRPIEQVVIVPAADRQIEFRIAAFDTGDTRLDTSGAAPASQDVSFTGVPFSDDPRKNAGFLLTGDSSIVYLQASLFYQITDPAAYVLAADHVAPALQRLFVAAAVAVCAGRDLDTILVARPELSAAADALAAREQLRNDLMNATNRRLEDLAEQSAGLGITVSRVDLAAAIPIGAKFAFDQVLVATQWVEKDVADARAAAELTMQTANQTSDRTLAEAQAKAEEQVNDARSRTSAIEALAAQSGVSGQMLRDRIYYDRIGPILAKAARVDAIDANGGVHLMLPGATQK